MSPRGTTRTGRPSALPSGDYSPLPAQQGLVVSFHGEDGRSYIFDIGSLPLPGWHESLAAAWAVRVGPTGSLRTKESTRSAWGALTRMIRFYGHMIRPPRTPADLTVEHVEAYHRFRTAELGDDNAARSETRVAGLTFLLPPLVDLVQPDVLDRLRPHVRARTSPMPGYSDGELARLVSAARAEIRELIERLDPARTTDLPDQRRFDALRRYGRVPTAGVRVDEQRALYKRIAPRLYVTRFDVTAMLVLLVANTGWNVEVMKELPFEHRILDGRAVEVDLIKRRRGPQHWHQTVTWEIGAPAKQLNTPGGTYLLFHQIMTAARRHADPNAFWATWHPGISVDQLHRCTNPFALGLDADIDHQEWVKARRILADDTDADGTPQSLALNFNRLKTSIDVRRTRDMGGHLPSAARSNSTEVLFRNYLAGDGPTIEWAQEVLTETLSEVEQAAWTSHQRALAEHGRSSLKIRSRNTKGGTPADEPARAETSWTTCTDHEHHPQTGRRCSASFLDCFHCGNCLITSDHLPRLLSLLGAWVRSFR